MIFKLFIFLFSFDCLAGDIPPLFQHGKYSEAESKAQDAFVIQIGIQSKIDTVKSYASKIGEYGIDKLGIKKPLSVIGTGYYMYKNRSISFPIRNIRFELHQDQIKCSIPLP